MKSRADQKLGIEITRTNQYPANWVTMEPSPLGCRRLGWLPVLVRPNIWDMNRTNQAYHRTYKVICARCWKSGWFLNITIIGTWENPPGQYFNRFIRQDVFNSGDGKAIFFCYRWNGNYTNSHSFWYHTMAERVLNLQALHTALIVFIKRYPKLPVLPLALMWQSCTRCDKDATITKSHL